MRHDVLVSISTEKKTSLLVEKKLFLSVYRIMALEDAYIFPRLLEKFAKDLKGTGVTAEASKLMAVGYGPNIKERKELHFTSHYRPCDKTSVTCATSNDNEKERQVKNSDSRGRT